MMHRHLPPVLFLLAALLLLAACAERPRCLVQGETATVVAVGIVHREVFRGRGPSTSIDPFSSVKVRGPKIGTRICTISDTSFDLLKPGDPLVGPWG